MKSLFHDVCVVHSEIRSDYSLVAQFKKNNVTNEIYIAEGILTKEEADQRAMDFRKAMLQAGFIERI